MSWFYLGEPCGQDFYEATDIPPRKPKGNWDKDFIEFKDPNCSSESLEIYESSSEYAWRQWDHAVTKMKDKP
jgi:hypothetical protein